MQNKVIKITLPGGLLGLFFGNARETLERQIQKENESGWRVIQVENHLIKNLLNYTIDLIILLLTLLVYTRGSEYYIKLERESRPSSDISDEFFEFGKITLDDLKKKFIELPTLQKSAVIVVPILYILLAFYTFVPPYLAEIGLIFDGVFYERIGDLPESSPVAGSKRQKSDPLPATVPPEQPQQPAPPQAQPTPAPSTGGSSIGVLTGEGVRLRSSMDKTSKTNIIDKFAKGTQVQILENHGEWLRVRVNGKEGFMAAQFVQPQ
ncbi:MAG: SH3 domain-containing protein [Chloroherpetonaceae bacterium]